MKNNQTVDELEELFKNGVDETMGEFYEKIRKLFKKQRMAFGSCTKCYGKGYATRATHEIGFPDFPGDKRCKKQLDQMIFCDCGRGIQLKKIVQK